MSPTTSTSPAVSFFDFPMDHSLGMSPFGPWEEPHPGRRLSYPFETASDLAGRAVGACAPHPSTGCGGSRGGMAAKGHSPNNIHRPSRPWLVRRHARLRTRDQPIVLPAGAASSVDCSQASTLVTESSSTTATTIGTARNASTSSVGSATASVAASVAASISTRASAKPQLSLDTDVNSSTAKSPVAHPASPYIFADVSNFLGVSGAPDSGVGPVLETPSDDSSLSHAAPKNDLYGWDAELERHVPPGSAVPAPCSAFSSNGYDDYDGLGIRQGPRSATAGPKRSLLRRVFHMNNAAAASREGIIVEPQPAHVEPIERP